MWPFTQSITDPEPSLARRAEIEATFKASARQAIETSIKRVGQIISISSVIYPYDTIPTRMYYSRVYWKDFDGRYFISQFDENNEMSSMSEIGSTRITQSVNVS